MIEPLRKKALDGRLYSRFARIEAMLAELMALSRKDLVARSRISKRDDPGYVPSECLLHFVRATRLDNSGNHFEQLYKILAERVWRCLPRAENPDGTTISLTKSAIREKVFRNVSTIMRQADLRIRLG